MIATDKFSLQDLRIWCQGDITKCFFSQLEDSKERLNKALLELDYSNPSYKEHVVKLVSNINLINELLNISEFMQEFILETKSEE